MAQNSFNLVNSKGQEVIIISTREGGRKETKNSVTLLKSYFDQTFKPPFVIQTGKIKN